VKRLQQKQTRPRLVKAMQNYVRDVVQKAPVAISHKMTMGTPNYVKSSSNGDITVRHTEYIAEVPGSINFNVTQYTIQPGLSQSFPWLAQLSGLYEAYIMNRCTYHFKTEKSTATNGSVMLAVDFDVSDSAPLNKQALMTYKHAVRTQPWSDVDYVLDPADIHKLKERYVRSGLIVGDYKIYDVGNLFIATQGCADTSILGELYVTYDITFKTPQYDAAGYASAGSNKSTGTTGITSTLVLGTVPNLNVLGSGMPITYSTTTGAIGFANPGQYLVILSITTTAASSGTDTLTLTGGSTYSASPRQNSTNNYTWIVTVNILNAGDTMTYSGVTFTGPSASSLRIASYPFSLI